jgi:outer membrane lipoprotein-sorting protein
VLLRCLLCLGVVLASACGDSTEARREALRAEAERQFGRPSESQPTGAAPAESEPPGSASAESPPGESGTVDDPDPPSGGAVDPTPDPLEDPPSGAGAAQTQDTEAPTEPPTGQEPAAALLLEEADAAYSGLTSLRAAFVQRVDLPLVDRTAQGHGTWYQAGRGRFRMDFTDPPDDVFVADGTSLWLYQPSATPGQVIKSPLGGGGQAAGGADVLANILSEARASYDADYEGTAIVSGERCHVIALTPRGPSEYRLVRVWVADGDRLVRRFRIEEQNETIRTVTLADLEPNVPLPDSLFDFTPPDGVEVFDRGRGN